MVKGLGSCSKTLDAGGSKKSVVFQISVKCRGPHNLISAFEM